MDRDVHDAGRRNLLGVILANIAVIASQDTGLVPRMRSLRERHEGCMPVTDSDWHKLSNRQAAPRVAPHASGEGMRRRTSQLRACAGFPLQDVDAGQYCINIQYPWEIMEGGSMTAGNGVGIATSRAWTDGRRTRGNEHRFSDRLKLKLDVNADWIGLSIHNAIVLRLIDTLARGRPTPIRQFFTESSASVRRLRCEPEGKRHEQAQIY